MTASTTSRLATGTTTEHPAFTALRRLREAGFAIHTWNNINGERGLIARAIRNDTNVSIMYTSTHTERPYLLSIKTRNEGFKDWTYPAHLGPAVIDIAIHELDREVTR